MFWYLSVKFGQSRITDENPAARATVLAAIRYTFAENSQAYDEALSPVIMDFLGLITDSDLVCALFSSVPHITVRYSVFPMLDMNL